MATKARKNRRGALLAPVSLTFSEALTMKFAIMRSGIRNPIRAQLLRKTNQAINFVKRHET